MKKVLEYILREQKVVYAIFDKELAIESHCNNFHKMLNAPDRNYSGVFWDTFQELIGSEDQIEALLEQKQRKYKLEKLSRYRGDDQLIYYSLVLYGFQYPGDSSPSILAIVIDTTENTSLEQQIQQQQNEIKLLHASLVHYLEHGSNNIIGSSEQIEHVRRFIRKIANIRNTTILLQGESGTGKNLVARAIHFSSIYSKQPFVEVNCAAIPDTLLESELLGHEKGAFTNATSSKKGLLEEADGGTLFLDEISEMPLALQAKLLSFIETKRFRRLGSTIERTVQVRIITATNRDLKRAVEKKEFRQDLYFRINVLTLKLPPLRDLGDDIIAIAERFVQNYAVDFGKRFIGLTREAKMKLKSHSWAGNVRELRNVIERAAIFSEGSKIDEDVIYLMELEDKKKSNRFSLEIPDAGISMVEVEKQLLIKALEKANNNQTKTAKLLGMSLDTLRYRMKKYNISLT